MEIKMKTTQTQEITLDEIQNVKLSGILLLGSIVSVFICLAFVIPNNLTLNPLDMSATYFNINQHPALHILELVFDEISNIMTLLLTGSLFLAFHRINSRISLIASLLIGCGSMVMVVHDMGNFAITWIAKAYGSAGGVEKVVLEQIGSSMIITAKWGVVIGASCIILGILFYNFLWITHKVIPKVLGYLGILCSVLAILAMIPYWLDFSLEELGYNLYFPFMIWEIVIAILFIRIKSK
jgi:hypothetical protein